MTHPISQPSARLAALAISMTLALVVATACAPIATAKSVDLHLTSRSVPLTGKLTIALVSKTADKLIELDSISHAPIFLMVNAFGDSVEAAFALVDTLRSIQSPVIAVVQSRAYDMGAVVALSCAKTYVYPHAVLMLRPVDKVSTEIAPPKEPDEEFSKRFTKTVYAAIAGAIGLDADAYAEKVRDGWWLTAQDALRAGVADGIVGRVAHRDLVIEKTEIKTTVTTIEEKQVPPAAKIPKKR